MKLSDYKSHLRINFGDVIDFTKLNEQFRLCYIKSFSVHHSVAILQFTVSGMYYVVTTSKNDFEVKGTSFNIFEAETIYEKSLDEMIIKYENLNY